MLHFHSMNTNREISPIAPGSALRLVGDKVSVFIDELAASKLE